MKIEVLYFAGCPNHMPTVDLARQAVADLGINAEVNEVEVKTDEDAQRLRFLGSPSIQIDGTDIDPSVRSRTDYGFSCRMYRASGIPPKEMLEAALTGDSIPPVSGNLNSNQRTGLMAAGAAVAAAILASACCIVPLAMLAAGVSTAGFSAAIQPFRPYFLGATALFLAGGFYFAYFRKGKCSPGSACAAPSRRLQGFTRAGLWAATLAVGAFALFPNYAGTFFGKDTMAQVTGAPADLRRVTLSIEGMTCEACAANLENALGEVPGVQAAAVNYDKEEAFVVLEERSAASNADLLEAVAGAGYRADLKPGDS